MNPHVFTTYPSGFVNTSGFIPTESTVDANGNPIQTYAQKRAAQPKKE
jgi:hypothetical protein